MLSLKLDYPPKQKFIKFDEKMTLGQLKQEVAKSFDLKMDEVDRHEFRAVAYGQNVIDIGNKDEKTTLSSEGVKTKSLIVVCAPNDLKPVVERKGKKKGKDDDDDGDSKDKYSGYKVETAIKQWETSKGKDEKIALEYIDINLSAIMKTPEWTKLEKKKESSKFVKEILLMLKRVIYLKESLIGRKRNVNEPMSMPMGKI